MRAEDLRLVALVLLACAAVAIAGDVLVWGLGGPLLWVLIVALAALLCIVSALVLIVSARREERRLMDRIDNL
jgi:cyanate permease